jgi:hypothetical protein
MNEEHDGATTRRWSTELRRSPHSSQDFVSPVWSLRIPVGPRIDERRTDPDQGFHQFVCTGEATQSPQEWTIENFFKELNHLMSPFLHAIQVALSFLFRKQTT